MDYFRIIFGLRLNFNKHGDFDINDKLQGNKEIYHFGSFRLDIAERRLWCVNEPIQLSPKQFDLLLYFVENPGRVATKSELLDAVWADTYIAESTLARNVSWLRKELAECSHDEPIIETVPKHGYRFTAEVTRSADDKNALIIEEQTVQHIRGEETITINDAADEREKKVNNTNISSSSVVSPFSAIALPLVIILSLIAFVGVGFIVYQKYFESRAMTAIVASPVVPFSGATGYENSPVFSPDSKQLAYSWDGGEGGESDIYIKPIGAGKPLRLTETEANEHYPTFSPDGKQIAFIRGKYGEPGEVILIPSIGGTEYLVTRLFSGNYSISFSPDGQSIAVVDTENSKEGGQYAVYIVNIKTGERRRVTDSGDFLGETTPRFSPDGKSLAFIRVFTEDAHARNLGKQDLFVVPAGGGKSKQLTFDGVIINSLTWSADGDYIYFVPVRPPNQTVVRRISVSGGEQEIVSTGSKDITNIAVSPDGKRLVFAEDVRQWSIWRVPPNGQRGKKLMDSIFNEFFPQFSPDGSRIAFQADRTGEYQIWTVDANGENLRQITDTPFPSSAPHFSPDSLRIVFNQKEGENFYNYIVSGEGGVPQRISPEGVQEDFPIWSADGKYIYFSSNRSKERNIWRMNGDGSGEAVQITTIGAYRATPAPDSKFIYFTKTGFPKEFWRAPTQGGAEEVMPKFEAAGFNNVWAMTKTGIYFIAFLSDQSLKLKFYDFADGEIKDVSGGEYKIPSNLDGAFITIHEKVLLCSVMEKRSSLMIADLP